MMPLASPQVLLFGACDLRLGVFMAEIGRLVDEGELAPVPFAHAAMAGLLDDDVDGPLPIFELRALLDATHRPVRRATGATIAIFPTPRGPIGLRLDALHGTIVEYSDATRDEGARLLGTLPPTAIHFLSGAALTGGTPFFFFSPEGLVLALGLTRTR
jgi:hypothetical protein